MVGHHLTGQSFPRYRLRRLSMVVPSWCGWGVLWLVVAQPTIRFCVFSRRAAFWRVRSISISFSLAGELGDLSGLGLPVSLFHGISIRPPADLVALAMRLMAWCFVVCWCR